MSPQPHDPIMFRWMWDKGNYPGRWRPIKDEIREERLLHLKYAISPLTTLQVKLRNGQIINVRRKPFK